MKYPCQGPYCHTYSTKDRFNKKLKRLKGRNAYHSIDMGSIYSIFCTTICKNDWIVANVKNIVRQKPTTFIHERKLSEDTYHLGPSGWLRRDEDRVDSEQIMG